MNKKQLAALGLLALVLITSGCISDNSQNEKPVTTPTKSGVIEQYDINGTTCYVYTEDSVYAGQGGLSCDFS